MLPKGFLNISNAGQAVLSRLNANPEWKRLPFSHRPELSVDFLMGGVDSEAGRKVSYVLYFNEGERKMCGLAQFGSLTEGPKGCVHGGAMAALLDVAMGTVCWYSKLRAVTGNLTVNYRNLLPINSTVLVESWIVSAEEGSSKVHVAARLSPLCSDSTEKVATTDKVATKSNQTEGSPLPYSESEGLFVRMANHPSSSSQNKVTKRIVPRPASKL